MGRFSNLVLRVTKNLVLRMTKNLVLRMIKNLVLRTTNNLGYDMRIWFKIWKETRLVRDVTIEDFSDDTRTHKIMNALDEACRELDLAKPIWLDSAVEEFKKTAQARFYKDAFMESIDFDYLQIHVIEEDY